MKGQLKNLKLRKTISVLDEVIKIPYIPKNQREELDSEISNLASRVRLTFDISIQPGVVNYTLTRLLSEIFKNIPENYAKYEKMVGLLELIKMELMRKKIFVYEDQKCKQNGEVF